jgi:anti-sigma B factor antagonist
MPGTAPTGSPRPQGAGSSSEDGGVIMVTLNGDVTIYVEGAIDMASGPELWDHLKEAIPEARQRLVIDLSATTFLDSTALNLFVRAHKRLQGTGAELILRSPSEMVIATFQISGLDKVLRIET